MSSSKAAKRRVLIIGAAGRDFHNFNVFFRNNPLYEVVGFTATQIPNIDGRKYPAALAGKQYPRGLLIWPETQLEKVIKEEKVDVCVLAYSDLNHSTVMQLNSRVQASGASFMLLGPNDTMIKSKKPVIAITAVRTGSGKSQTTVYIADIIKKLGKKPVVVRHPMPYGDLVKQKVQRFGDRKDLVKHEVTIEEREEYEQHIDRGTILYAGVDYQAILDEVEKEADVVLWDGGNNDTPFYKPDLWICVADPHRAGHETRYYPGDVNFRGAHVIVINKVNTAEAKNVEAIKAAAAAVNPKALVFECDSLITVDKPEEIKGKVVCTVDDGPTITHGEMAYGAGHFAAKEAKEVVDPHKYAKGSIDATYKKYTHIGHTIPAMGYWAEQIKDLEDTINSMPVEAVVVATPMDLRGLIKINKPVVVAKYALGNRGSGPYLSDEVTRIIGKKK